ncbi:MAG: DUF3368 domain-containing protein [Pseudomonadota bacterium]
MAKIVVADTGSLIALAILDMLPILPNLFDEIYAPDAVINEALVEISQPGAKAIDTAIKTALIKPYTVEVTELFKDLVDYLDQGEAEALTLAKLLNAIAIIDEKRARKFALTHGIKITGSAAILIAAKNEGSIDSVKPALEKLKYHGYRMSESLIDDILRRVEE